MWQCRKCNGASHRYSSTQHLGWLKFSNEHVNGTSVWVDSTSPAYRTSSSTTFFVFLLALLVTAKWRYWGSPTFEAATYRCPWVNVGSCCQNPTFLCLTINFVDCHRNSRLDRELASGPFNKLLILAPYSYSGDEHFLSIIVNWGDLSIEKDVGSFIKDVSWTIAKSLPGFAGAWGPRISLCRCDVEGFQQEWACFGIPREA